MNLKLMLLFLLIPLAGGADLHKFFVGHVSLRYSDKEQSLQVSAKLFTDDLEKVLAEGGFKKIRLDGTVRNEDVKEALNSYFQQHLKISVPGNESKCLLIGWEQESDLTWIYLEVPGLRNSPTHIDLHCSLLTSSFEEQQNIIHIEMGDKHRSVLLNARETDLSLDL